MQNDSKLSYILPDVGAGKIHQAGRLPELCVGTGSGGACCCVPCTRWAGWVEDDCVVRGSWTGAEGGCAALATGAEGLFAALATCCIGWNKTSIRIGTGLPTE